MKSAAQTTTPEKISRDKNLFVIFGITLIAIMGVSSITPAFPKIGRSLGVSPQDIALLITVFTVPGVFLTPVLGILADRFGRKTILVPALFLFGLAGSACFGVDRFSVLVGLRFFQGIGASGLGALNITIIGDLYSGRTRVKVMGYNASVLSIGTAGFPLIGGGLAMFGWYFPFLLPLLALPVGLCVMFILKIPPVQNDQQFHAYLKAAWQSVRNKKVFGLFLIGIVTFILLYGACLTYFPFILNEYYGATPLIIGVVMFSMSISSAVTASQTGRITKYLSAKNMLLLAFLLYSVALGLAPLIQKLWLMILPAAILGIGNGLNLPTVQALLTGLAPIEQRGIVMSLNGMVLRIGQTLGPFIMTLVFSGFGFTGVFLTGSLLAFSIIFLVSWIFRQ